MVLDVRPDAEPSEDDKNISNPTRPPALPDDELGRRQLAKQAAENAPEPAVEAPTPPAAWVESAAANQVADNSAEAEAQKAEPRVSTAREMTHFRRTPRPWAPRQVVPPAEPAPGVSNLESQGKTPNFTLATPNKQAPNAGMLAEARAARARQEAERKSATLGSPPKLPPTEPAVTPSPAEIAQPAPIAGPLPAPKARPRPTQVEPSPATRDASDEIQPLPPRAAPVAPAPRPEPSAAPVASSAPAAPAPAPMPPIESSGPITVEPAKTAGTIDSPDVSRTAKAPDAKPAMYGDPAESRAAKRLEMRNEIDLQIRDVRSEKDLGARQREADTWNEKFPEIVEAAKNLKLVLPSNYLVGKYQPPSAENPTAKLPVIELVSGQEVEISREQLVEKLREKVASKEFTVDQFQQAIDWYEVAERQVKEAAVKQMTEQTGIKHKAQLAPMETTPTPSTELPPAAAIQGAELGKVQPATWPPAPPMTESEPRPLDVSPAIANPAIEPNPANQQNMPEVPAPAEAKNSEEARVQIEQMLEQIKAVNVPGLTVGRLTDTSTGVTLAITYNENGKDVDKTPAQVAEILSQFPVSGPDPEASQLKIRQKQEAIKATINLEKAVYKYAEFRKAEGKLGGGLFARIRRMFGGK